jgi:hypothetical protein
MNFRAPGAGVLGPRPPFQQQNAMLAQGSPASPQVPSSTSVWDQAALYSALSSAGVNAQLPPSSGDWYMDTGASSHITNMPGHFSNPHPLPFPTYITVGNGARLPVTHTAATSIPTNSSSLHLNNILVSPSIVKNLVSVRQLTRDNNVSIEFDPVGFSVKDLPTKTVILRCESSGALYPLRLPPQIALSATSSVDLWHARLGHPGSTVLRQVLHSFDFRCNKTEAHSCHSCRVGKSVRLPFSNSTSSTYFPFQLVHADVWTSPVSSFTGYKFYLVLIDDFTHYTWSFPV